MIIDLSVGILGRCHVMYLHYRMLFGLVFTVLRQGGLKLKVAQNLKVILVNWFMLHLLRPGVKVK
jgi:hypothetical protein